jgi:DNA-directed RNA polymerase specialized sigma24 family protein
MSSPACRLGEVEVAQSLRESCDQSREHSCEASAIDRDADAVVGALVRHLSRDERLLVCLRYADGLTDEEIAALTRMTVVDVRRSMQSILDRTRSLVGSAC